MLSALRHHTITRVARANVHKGDMNTVAAMELLQRSCISMRCASYDVLLHLCTMIMIMHGR